MNRVGPPDNRVGPPDNRVGPPDDVDALSSERIEDCEREIWVMSPI